MPTLRFATFQRRPIFDDVAATTAQLLEDLAWCDKQGVQLALFPECYLQAYATDRATIAGRAWDLQAEAFQNLLTICKTVQTSFILGLIEQRGDKFYNSAVVIQGGTLSGLYAKTHPNEAGFDAGVDYPVFDIDGWRVGINICNDANFPAAALYLRKQGAELICYLLNNLLTMDTAHSWKEKHLAILQQRARDTGCWIASSDVTGRFGDKIAYGCSCIVRPDGTVAGRVTELHEDVLVFNMD